MDQSGKKESLVSAWRALDTGSGDMEGWRTIPIFTGSTSQVLAGRHFPGGEEAVLFGFRISRMPARTQLPEGNGFSVTAVGVFPGMTDFSWLALTHQPAGSIELFTMMATDIVEAFLDSRSLPQETLVMVFLGRVLAWQNFMQKGKDGVLGPEEETGLFGELVILQSMIDTGVHPTVAVGYWTGPLDALHDFSINAGAIEVKTTAASGDMTVKNTSLEQLDDTLSGPLYLAGIRLKRDESGQNLPEYAKGLQQVFRPFPDALTVFEMHLLRAGFAWSVSDRYTRQFRIQKKRLLQVNSQFPRLTRQCVPDAVQSVRYTINLDSINQPDLPLIVILTALGAVHNGT
jgi:hypothetical protein